MPSPHATANDFLRGMGLGPMPVDAPFADLIQRHGAAMVQASAQLFRGRATDALMSNLVRVTRVIKCERCGHPCAMTFRDVPTADGFRVLTCPVCEGGELHPSADATGEP